MKRIRARHARKAPRNSKDRSSKNSKTNQKLREYISPNSIKLLILIELGDMAETKGAIPTIYLWNIFY